MSIAGGWPAKAVTFIENHDTARKPFEDFPGDRKRLLQGYAFLLTHPGVPCIFFSHLMEKGPDVLDPLKDLCLLRRAQNIARTSWVEVLRSGPACYAALIDGRTIVKIGDEFWGPNNGAGWKLSLSGEGWAIWTK